MYADETQIIAQLVAEAALSAEDRARICAHGAALVSQIRASTEPGLMEVFLAEYGLSTDCLLYTSPSPRDRTRSRMPSSA